MTVTPERMGAFQERQRLWYFLSLGRNWTKTEVIGIEIGCSLDCCGLGRWIAHKPWTYPLSPMGEVVMCCLWLVSPVRGEWCVLFPSLTCVLSALNFDDLSCWLTVLFQTLLVPWVLLNDSFLCSHRYQKIASMFLVICLWDDLRSVFWNRGRLIRHHSHLQLRPL